MRQTVLPFSLTLLLGAAVSSPVCLAQGDTKPMRILLLRRMQRAEHTIQRGAEASPAGRSASGGTTSARPEERQSSRRRRPGREYGAAGNPQIGGTATHRSGSGSMASGSIAPGTAWPADFPPPPPTNTGAWRDESPFSPFTPPAMSVPIRNPYARAPLLNPGETPPPVLNRSATTEARVESSLIEADPATGPAVSEVPSDALRGSNEAIRRNPLPISPFAHGSIDLGQIHTVMLAGGLLLCLLLLLVILVLLRLLFARNQQTIRLEMGDAPLLNSYLQSSLSLSRHASREESVPASAPTLAPTVPDPASEPRNTAVADLASDGMILEGLQTTLQQEWEAREKEAREQEASIIQSVVDQNLDLGAQLAGSTC